MLGQGGEDAPVDTDYTHHRQTGHGDERGSADAGDTLDGFAVVGNHILDNRAGVIGIEGVLHADGDILHAYGIDGRRINHLGTEVAELHGFHIAQFGDGIGGMDDARVGGHEPVDISPYLEHFGIERSRDNRGGIVASSTAEIGGLARLFVGTDESRNDIGMLQRLLKLLLDERATEFAVEHIFAVFLFGLDKVARVHSFGPFDEVGHDMAAQPLAVADDGRLGLRTEVADEKDTIQDGAQLLEESVEGLEQHLLASVTTDDRLHHLVVSLHHGFQFGAVGIVAGKCQFGCGYQPIGDASQGTHYDNHLFGLCLNDLLDAEYALYGTDRRSSKFQDFHVQSILFASPLRMGLCFIFMLFRAICCQMKRKSTKKYSFRKLFGQKSYITSMKLFCTRLNTMIPKSITDTVTPRL